VEQEFQVVEQVVDTTQALQITQLVVLVVQV
jgi:hypothetical protein